MFDKFRQRKALVKDLRRREEELRQVQLNMAYGPFGQPPSYDEVARDKLNESATPYSTATRTESSAAYSTLSDSSSSASSVASIR